ncbi:YibE/F family protein [Corynebacterium caspium]|uniref:YibE/F family protein n=1 Tax=Corynebacterium caspium TaxID=234828 RepID=UPI0003602FCE|nr:YibE/F family protein [Corynebacterium caspium]WKD59339.1 YibE/F-like protein [Corynebacterium caspium DSM 44850]
MGRHYSQKSIIKTSGVPRAILIWRRILLGFLAFCAIATTAGLILLWPTNEPINITPEFKSTFNLSTPHVKGTVTQVTSGACQSNINGQVFEVFPATSPSINEDTCDNALIEITSGENAGKNTILVTFGQTGEPQLSTGDKIVLNETTDINNQTTYGFSDYQRGPSLLLWGLVIALATIALAGFRGMRALIGLIIALAVVGFFLIPALIHGGPAVPLAMVSGSAILFLVVLLVHGVNWKSAAALAGTLTALIIAAGLAWLAIDSTKLAGYGDESNLQIILYLPDVSVSSLMLCGFIIGSLGVLNDVTISQASTVNELAALEPQAKPMRLFTGAMKVGRDHISSMVYTLVLTYTGAALPLLLLISVSGRPVLDTLTSDVMATELLRSGVGALALTLAVPITTIFAAVVVPNGKEHGNTPATPGHLHSHGHLGHSH